MKRSVIAFWIIVALVLLCWPLALFAESDGSLTGVLSTPGTPARVVSATAWASPGTIGSTTANTGKFTTVVATTSIGTDVSGGASFINSLADDGQQAWVRLLNRSGLGGSFYRPSGATDIRAFGAGAGADLFAFNTASLATGTAAFFYTRDATSSTTAALQSAGGLAVAMSAFIGGDLVVATAGKELKIKEGSNASMGTAVLVAGTLVVSNTLVTASSRIYLTSQVDGGTPGFLRISARTAGTSFTILSSSGTDTSTVAWHIVEPAP